MTTMRFLAITAIALSSVLFTACLCNKAKEVSDKMSEAKKDLQNTKEVLEGYKDIGKNFQKSQDEIEAFNEMRKEKGDTISMPYGELAEMMPELKGYTKLKPKGETLKMGGITYSTCTQVYERMNEDGSKDKVEIQIIDYNGANSLYSMASAMLNVDIELDTDSESLKKYNTGIDHVSAMETHKKSSGNTTITSGIAYRFFATVKADSKETAAQAFESLPLKEMSKM